MIFLITGCSHTGKTLLAQQLLERYHYPYLSVDHLKMGLIRSGYTHLTPEDDTQLTELLWPIVREIIKTAIKNHQNLIVEGCYIPFDWKDYFNESEQKEIRFCCLIMTEAYINRHMAKIKQHANVIEQRLDDSFCTPNMLVAENARNHKLCQQYGCPILWIDREYPEDLALCFPNRYQE